MNTTDLRARLAAALMNDRRLGLFHREAYDIADLAIAIVVEECARVCGEHWSKAEDFLARSIVPENRYASMQRASEAKDIAADIRNLAGNGNGETT